MQSSQNRISDPALPAPNPMVTAARRTRTIIQPSSRWKLIDFGEVLDSRELLFTLMWRDFRSKYRHTYLGAAWALLQPLSFMAVFTLFLKSSAHSSGSSTPYPLSTYACVVLWMYFSGSVGKISGSLSASAGLISKVYFPRLLIPLSAMSSPLVDLCLSLLGLVFFFFWFGIVPTITGIISVPLIVFLTGLMALGFGLWFCAIYTRLRDLAHAIPLLLQLWMFATPVAYSIERADERYRFLLALNPMTGVIGALRSALFGEPFSAHSLCISVGFTLFLVVSGLFVFARAERNVVDVL